MFQLPMLLDDPSEHALNGCADDLMKDSSLHQDVLDSYPSLDELGGVDPMQWAPEAFPNLAPLPDEPDCQIKEEIKIEPVSPLTLLPPSPTPSSSSSSDTWVGGESLSEVKFVLETPPISPPQMSDGSPPSSPQPNSSVGNKSQDSVVMMSPVKIVPVSKNGIKVGGGARIVITQAANATKSVKIQPKPEPGISQALPVVTVPKINKESRTIVLTAQDFATLTRQVKNHSNGTIKNPPTVRIQTLPPKQSQPQAQAPAKVQAASNLTTSSVTVPVQQPVVNSKVPILKKPVTAAVTSVPATPVVTAVPPPVKRIPQPIPGRQELEMKAIKRQQRMIKNRESACLSRKKKKEYVTSLENQISELQQENVQLKLENTALKEKLKRYEENSTWRRPGVLNGNIRKTTAVLAVLFMVSFNLGSLGGLFHQGPGSLGELQGSPTSQKIRNSRHGRSLLWSDMDRRNLPSIEDPFEDIDSVSNTSNIHPTCPMFINQTESIRLDSELRRWIGVDLESENLTQQPESEVKSLGELLLPFPATKPPFHKLRPKRKQQVSRKQPAVSSEVEVYGVRPQQYNYAAFFEAIHRRDDTFYVVSFTGDHLLVPAVAHNKTVRPKMSLVLPALPFNESMTAPPNYITMMQIDCEVTNTQLLHVKKGDIPAHLRQNDTGHYSNSTASNKANTEDHTDQHFTSESHRPAMSRSQPYRPYFMKPNHKKFMNTGEFPSESKLGVEFGNSNPYNVTSQRRANLNNNVYPKDDPGFT
ncbi:hypothetical protein Cfor_01456 [Coptotermes formosanus]|uniref:BZIP domain-containing protein n=1 Tax=Coptotermes formosanus TaxID=36987 RepID=A0A6L2Q7J1_COPFO|nr:hypothetical protein Cfor_01456 [Coptotermes formosanus]